MTNVSALLSFGFIPLWLLLVPKVVDVEIIVPFEDIAIGVAQLVGPFLIGAVINYKWNKLRGQYFSRLSLSAQNDPDKKQAIKAARYLTTLATAMILVALILSCVKFRDF